MPNEKVGRYEILEVIGQGGQSVAYRARDPKIDRIVAIKKIRATPDIPERTRAEFFGRFMREAQAAGRLTHPNIAVIYDVGGDEEGDPYIAMEFIDGVNLESLIANAVPLPQERVLNIFVQLCGALHYAHQCGIVHRDIKPGNIMITRDDRVKVVDFGIAKLTASNLTQAGMVMGTPSYMSPEQIMGKPVDHRSDIFSLGVVLYETLTGERPFTGENPTTIIFKIVQDRHASVLVRKPGLYQGLDAVLDNALAKDPELRYQTCAEMGRDLEFLVRVRGTATTVGSGDTITDFKPVASTPGAGMARPAADALNALPTATMPAATTLPLFAAPRSDETGSHPAPDDRPPEPRAAGRGKILGILGAAAVVVLSLAAYFWFSRGSQAPAPEQPPAQAQEPAQPPAAEPPPATIPVQPPAAVSVPSPDLIAQARAALGRGNLVGEQKNDALYFANAALAANPASAEGANLKTEIRAALVRRSDAAAQKAKPEEVLAAYDRLLKYFPADSEIQAKREGAQSRLAKERLAADLENAQRAGEKAYREGNSREAIRQYGQVVSLDPRNAAAFYYLGRSYEAQQDLDKAIEHFKRACELAPADPTYVIQLGLAQEKRRDLADAVKSITRAIELGGNGNLGVDALKALAAGLKLRLSLAEATPYSAQVRHDHLLGSGCTGTLTITETAITYAPAKQQDHALKAGLETVKTFVIRKDRLDIVLTSGKKYTYVVPDPAPVAKIMNALGRSK